MDVDMTDDTEDQNPIECLKLKPKKSILKNRVNSVEEKQHQSDEPKAHFDEMNIMATFHPADKDYGHMKIDEPNTPYYMSDTEDDGASTSSHSKRRVSLVELEKRLDEKLSNPHEKSSHDEDSEDEIDEEEKRRREQFLNKRKEHYVKEAIPFRQRPLDEEEA